MAPEEDGGSGGDEPDARSDAGGTAGCWLNGALVKHDVETPAANRPHRALGVADEVA